MRGWCSGSTTALDGSWGRNSGNSSMPPSFDDLPAQKPPPRSERGSGRTRGQAARRGEQFTAVSGATRRARGAPPARRVRGGPRPVPHPRRARSTTPAASRAYLVVAAIALLLIGVGVSWWAPPAPTDPPAYLKVTYHNTSACGVLRSADNGQIRLTVTGDNEPIGDYNPRLSALTPRTPGMSPRPRVGSTSLPSASADAVTIGSAPAGHTSSMTDRELGCLRR